jgi:GTP pyrophosphokinase
MLTELVAASEEQFFEQIKIYLSADEQRCVQEAYFFAREKHGNQHRRSGEPFIQHPRTVAYYLATYHLDAPTLAAALLHDVAEDTSVSIREVKRRFGPEVAAIVDGVTKLKDVSKGISREHTLSKQEIQDLSTQKLFREMANDVRVVVVKLFDRLHNMRTIEHMAYESQVRKAQETLYVFAPMANRLGMWELKSELDARCLQVLDSDAYNRVAEGLERLRVEQQEMFQLISGQILELLLHANLDVLKVNLVPENIYTVYLDLKSRGLAYNDIDRTMRLVVLFDDLVSCYTALGYLHQLWHVVPNRFDDYISLPRDNLYRSLHTTVVHSSGQNVKIRLRTEKMDTVSQIGILASWLYADDELWDKGAAAKIKALVETVRENIAADHVDATAGVRSVVEDVLGEQIRVYTPRGDVVELAQGATPIDFAYAIHTELGDQCQAAYVNEMLSPLNRPLRNGDQVHIVKGHKAQPQREWLDEDLGYLKTNLARSHARRWFRRLPRTAAINQGKQLLRTELLMLGLPNYPHAATARLVGYQRTEELYHALGRAELLPTVVATRVLDENWPEEPLRSLDNLATSRRGEKYIITNAGGRTLNLCATCDPHPRDTIVGYLRKNGSVTVHRDGCHSLRANRTTGRLLKLGWGEEASRKARILTVQVDVYDRPGLLFDITRLMQREQINIAYICTPPTQRPGEVQLVLQLEVVSSRQAVRILHQTSALVNVFSVRCLTSVTDTAPANAIHYHPE